MFCKSCKHFIKNESIEKERLKLPDFVPLSVPEGYGVCIFKGITSKDLTKRQLEKKKHILADQSYIITASYFGCINHTSRYKENRKLELIIRDYVETYIGPTGEGIEDYEVGAPIEEREELIRALTSKMESFL